MKVGGGLGSEGILSSILRMQAYSRVSRFKIFYFALFISSITVNIIMRTKFYLLYEKKERCVVTVVANAFEMVTITLFYEKEKFQGILP